jgi:hypothetical protein
MNRHCWHWDYATFMTSAYTKQTRVMWRLACDGVWSSGNCLQHTSWYLSSAKGSFHTADNLNISLTWPGGLCWVPYNVCLHLFMCLLAVCFTHLFMPEFIRENPSHLLMNHCCTLTWHSTDKIWLPWQVTWMSSGRHSNRVDSHVLISRVYNMLIV